MWIIDASGNYQMVPGTGTVDTSDHPVYRARIEVALGQNTWPCRPLDGHQLAKYDRAAQTNGNIDKFQKELLLYLNKYGAAVKSLLGARGAVSMGLEISDGVLSDSNL
jgi:hypothetical protein